MAARLSLLDQPESPWAQQESPSAASRRLQSANSPPPSLSRTAPSNLSIAWPPSASESVPSAAGRMDVDPNRAPESRLSPPYPAGGDAGPPSYAESWSTGGQIGPEDLAHPSRSGSALEITPNSSQNLLESDNVLSTTNHITHPPGPDAISIQPTNSVPEEPRGSRVHPSDLEHALQAATTTTTRSVTERERQREQYAETYAIRQIDWTDHTGKLRESPVLVQNMNGPCPLLALVNGLVMRADRNSPPPIVKALRTREQISLGLLIQALFDELTTCRGADEPLPDIEDLSRFLTMLHTGMNVNPRLTLVPPRPSAFSGEWLH